MNKIERWRRKRGLRRVEAAEILGLSDTMLLRLESNDRTASLGMALRIERRSNGEVKAEDVPMTANSLRTLRTLRGAAA